MWVSYGSWKRQGQILSWNLWKEPCDFSPGRCASLLTSRTVREHTPVALNQQIWGNLHGSNRKLTDCVKERIRRVTYLLT